MGDEWDSFFDLFGNDEPYDAGENLKLNTALTDPHGFKWYLSQGIGLAKYASLPGIVQANAELAYYAYTNGRSLSADVGTGVVNTATDLGNKAAKAVDDTIAALKGAGESVLNIGKTTLYIVAGVAAVVLLPRLLDGGRK